MILHNTNFLFVFLYSTPKYINHKLISFIPLHSIISYSIFFNIQIYFIIFSNFLAYKGNIFFKNYYFFIIIVNIIILCFAIFQYFLRKMAPSENAQSYFFRINFRGEHIRHALAISLCPFLGIYFFQSFSRHLRLFYMTYDFFNSHSE